MEKHTAQRVRTGGHLEAWLFLIFDKESIPRALSNPSQSRMTESWLCEQHSSLGDARLPTGHGSPAWCHLLRSQTSPSQPSPEHSLWETEKLPPAQIQIGASQPQRNGRGIVIQSKDSSHLLPALALPPWP